MPCAYATRLALCLCGCLAAACGVSSSEGVGGAGGASSTSTGTTHEECLEVTDEAACEALGCIYAAVYRYPKSDLVCDAGVLDHVCTWYASTQKQSPHQYYRDTALYRYVWGGGGPVGGVVGFTYCDCCTIGAMPDPCNCLSK